jgi:hypothetical protein
MYCKIHPKQRKRTVAEVKQKVSARESDRRKTLSIEERRKRKDFSKRKLNNKAL